MKISNNFRDYLLSTIIVDNFTRDKITEEIDFCSKLIKKLDTYVQAKTFCEINTYFQIYISP